MTGLLVLLVLGLFGAMAGGSKNTQTGQSQETVASEAKPSSSPMKITARELADDFDANQVAAENKWKGKLVEFSAEISNITDSGLGFYKVATKEFSGTQISCRVTDKQQLLSLKNGQTVTVRGLVGNQTFGVIDVSSCQVVQ